MLAKFLADCVTDFKFHADREKVSGCMWGGSASGKIGDVSIGFQLWHHGSNNETMESLLPHLTVKYVNGKDAYWYALIGEDCIWFHPTGWFGNKELEQFIPRVNPNFYPRVIDETLALSLGFVKIV